MVFAMKDMFCNKYFISIAWIDCFKLVFGCYFLLLYEIANFKAEGP